MGRAEAERWLAVGIPISREALRGVLRPLSSAEETATDAIWGGVVAGQEERHRIGDMRRGHAGANQLGVIAPERS